MSLRNATVTLFLALMVIATTFRTEAQTWTGNGTVTCGTSTTPCSVGIGTVTPSATLEVNGTTRLTGNVFLGTLGVGTSTLYLWPDAGGWSLQGTSTGINVRAPKLDVMGAIKGNSHLGFMPWTNTGGPAFGYQKLKTGISPDQESNLFSLHIYGYRYYGPRIQAIDIRCSAYASPTYGLIAKACTTVGTDLPVELTTEPSNGVNYVVVRIGTPATNWYYAFFSVEYDGMIAKEPGTFTWTIDATVPPGTQPVNMNNVAIANNDGGSVVIGQVPTAQPDPATRLTVHGGVAIDGGAHVGSMTADGSITASTITAGTVIGAVYQDLAEWVPSTVKMDAGTVVVLNTDANNEVMPSDHAYDTAVAGVVSAKPGLLLGVRGEHKAQIATTGRVKVHVDASRHPVRVGDLLVTSDKPGMAMVSVPVSVGGIELHRPGTLVGKALEPLPAGEGDVLVLLSLQ